MARKQFLVIGAGRFGSAVATALSKLGHDVMVVDNDETLVQEISSEVTDAVTANAASESALKALDIPGYDAVILAIGYEIQASIMTALLLVEMGAKYTVAKAQTELHGKVLEKIGINRVVFPERDMGLKVAHSLVAPTIIDMIELSDEYSVVEVSAPDDMVGKTLKEIDLRARFGISVIALRRDSEGNTHISPVAEDVIKAGDIIVAVGDNKALKKLEWI